MAEIAGHRRGFIWARLSAMVACLSFAGAAWAVSTCFVSGQARCCSMLSQSSLVGYRNPYTCSGGDACHDYFSTNDLVPNAGAVLPPSGQEDLSLGVHDCVWTDRDCSGQEPEPCQVVGTTTRACFPSAPKGKLCTSPNPAG